MTAPKKTSSVFPLVITAIIGFSCCLPLAAFGQDELLIPLPGEKTGVSHSASDSEILIPLPPDSDLPRDPSAKPVKPDPSIIVLPGSKATETPTVIVTTTEPPIEITKPVVASMASVEPPPVEIAASGTAANNAPLPAFPKDTSSAIFMLMKNWECTNYDGLTLLGHSINTYGQEAEDKFEVKGLDRLAKFNLTLKEDDITLDELLDIMANKNGFDWGVDIPGKTIYLYPGGK